MNKLTRSDHAYILSWTKKIKAINLLGGKCSRCGEKDIFTLCFHHYKDKEQRINKLRTMRWSIIEKELKKCILLCQNCHRELHCDEHKKEITYKEHKINNKKIFMEYKGIDKCEQCGYNKCHDSLAFHHVKNKEFGLSSCIYYVGIDSVNDLKSKFGEIVDELNKCKVFCFNCHVKSHSDIQRFNILKTEIYKRVENYKEPNIIDKNIIIDLRKMGYSYHKIKKETGAAKTTIQNILARENLDGDIRKHEIIVT